MTRGYAIALAACLVLAGALDLVAGPAWFAVASFAVTAPAVVALVRPGGRWWVPAVAGSLLLTVGSALAPSSTWTGLGLAEAGSLVLLVLAAIRRVDHRADRLGRWTGPTLVAVAVLALPLRLGPTSDTATLALALAAVLAVAVAVGSSLRGADAARRAAVTVVRRAEREEVARELHDVVAHHVTGMVVATQAARVAGRGAGSDLDPTLASIESAGVEAMAAMRRLVDVLRTDPEDAADPTGPPGTPASSRSGSCAGDDPGPGRRTPVPRVAELVDLVHRSTTATRAGSVELRGAVDDLGDLPGELQATLYRVTQEALTNVARHAPGARRVVVELLRGGGEVGVAITDSGAPGGDLTRGADPAGGGHGLVGMRERVGALGGVLAVGPHGGGWRVRATLPDPAVMRSGTTRSESTGGSGSPDRWPRRRRGAR